MGFAFFGVLLVLVVLVVLARGLHPVSFPNLEVKPFCADGTATGGLWESRALPTVSWWWGCLVLFEGRHPHHFFVCGVFGGGCWDHPPFFGLKDKKSWSEPDLSALWCGKVWFKVVGGQL